MKWNEAKKVRIVDILNSIYIEDKKYYFLPIGIKAKRVNVVGTVLDKFEAKLGNYGWIEINDNSASIIAKSFDNVFEDIEVGDIVNVIGRIKSLDRNVYLNAEIAKKVDFKFEVFRKIEILSEYLELIKIIEKLRKLKESLKDSLEIYAKENYGFEKKEVELLLSFGKIEEAILEIIKDLKEVEVDKILEFFEISENGIERILNILENKGLIKKDGRIVSYSLLSKELPDS